MNDLFSYSKYREKKGSDQRSGSYSQSKGAGNFQKTTINKKAQHGNNTEKALSVTAFYRYINEILGIQELKVQGEISRVDVAKGYLVYISINDEENVLPCLIYKNKLDLNGIPVEALEVGTTIEITGIPNIYPKRGDFKFLAERVQLIGEGALRKAFELLKRKLQKEGLFDGELKRPIPQYPERIGLITSRGAAAFTDFLKVLKARFAGITIYFFPASVQGQTAVEEILEAFAYFNTKVDYLDAIVLTRGGGSLEDLAAFNAEAVVRAVRASKWPVVCAVGHERDESLAEHAADLRASTPSNAAELLVPTRQEEKEFLLSSEKKMRLHVQRLIEKEKQFLSNIVLRMEQFFTQPKIELKGMHEQLQRATTTWLSRIRFDINQKMRLLSSFNPHAVLKRGYSITSIKGDGVITSSKNISSGLTIETTVQDGKFISTTK